MSGGGTVEVTGFSGSGSTYTFTLLASRTETITVAVSVADYFLPAWMTRRFGGSRSGAIGATGAVLTTRLLHSMKRDGLKRGVVTLCIGGGQGIALALEML